MQTDCYTASLSTSSDCDGTDSDNIFVKRTMVRSRVGLLCASSILDDSSRRCGRVEILRKLLLFRYGVLSPAFSESAAPHRFISSIITDPRGKLRENAKRTVPRRTIAVA